MKKSVVTRMSLRSDKDVGTYLLKSWSDDNEKRKEGFTITIVIVLASSYLFLTGYVHFRLHNRKRHKTFKKLKKLCILIQIKSDLLELFYLLFISPDIGGFYEI
jgi:high-affinity Fe2+/Pb2+ permease